MPRRPAGPQRAGYGRVQPRRPSGRPRSKRKEPSIFAATTHRPGRLGAIAVVLVALAAAAPAGAATTPRISATPKLFPAFKASIHDYVVRCKNRPLKLQLSAPKGGTLAIDGGARRRGSFHAKVPLRTEQRFVVTSRRGSKRSVYSVRCLPIKFPKWTATRFGATQTAYYLLAPDGQGVSRYVAMFDRNGVPIWWYAAATNAFDAKLLPNGNVAWSRYYTNDILGYRPSQAYEEHTLTGKRVRVIKAVKSPTDIHDMQRLSNGNSLVVSYRPRTGVDLRPWGGPENAEVLDSVVEEITPKGKEVWEWNSKDHVSNDEKGPNIGTPVKVGNRLVYDLVHLNSVEPHGKNNSRLMVSMRATNAVYDIDRASGKILWKLGGTKTPESLTPLGDPHTQLFGGQHDARMLRDGTITLHDNRTGTGEPPRGVRFRIDEAARTATMLEQVSDPTVTNSNFAGSARKLPGGDWVASWGGTKTITELTAADKVVFRLEIEPGWFSYRAFPVLPGTIKASTLRRAMDKIAVSH